MANTIRAYRVSIIDDSVVIIVFAKSRNRAKDIVFGPGGLSSNECSYIDLRVRLAPEFEEINPGEEGVADSCKNADLFKKNDFGCFDLPGCENKNCVMQEGV